MYLKQRACHSYAGVATHYVPSERLEQLEDRLSDMESSDHEVINMVIEEYSTLTDTKQIGFEQEMRQIIDRYVCKGLPSPSGNEVFMSCRRIHCFLNDRCFRHDTVEAILEALDRERPMSFTREAKSKMLHHSPTSLRVILKLLRAGANKSLGECLQMEYDLVQKFMVRYQ